jgi:hypothetical protein
MSLVIGAYLWSQSRQYSSSCIAGVTVVSGLWTELNNIRISGSQAGTYTVGGGASVPHNYTFRMHELLCTSLVVLTCFKRRLVVRLERASCAAIITRAFSVVDVTHEQAMGGAVTIVTGAFVYSAMASNSYSPTSFGATSMQDCRVAVIGSSFVDCEAVSFTGGPATGTASVYGGALSLLHSPQVSIFLNGVLQPPQAPQLAGFNVTFSISSCSFTACSAVTNSTSVVPGVASGGGGAVYASSVAFTNVSLQSSSFSSCSVVVAIGASGSPSNSSGGGVSVDIPSVSNFTNASVLLSSNTFWNCSANGAGQSYPFIAVRGGGVAVSRAAAIKVSNTSFSTCSVAGASSVSVVSGGAGLSAVLVPSVSLFGCWFDGAAGQDSSGTSAGLLVLPSGAAPAHISIDTCSFSSVGNVSLKVTCVDAATGLNSVACVQPGHVVSASNSNISQLAPASDGSDFSSIGSAMVSLQQNVSVTSSNSLLVCNSTQFAVFKKILFSNGNVLYSCSPCPNLKISLTSNVALLETAYAAPLIAQCISLPSATTSCPFGIASCTTSVNVTSGFWAAFSDLTSGPLTNASHCPAGYCACGDSPSCLLPPPLSNAANPNPLCNGNRSGVLCGGCVSGFTQSLDGRTCISNQVCSQNVWWVWTLSILWWAVFGLGIVVSSSGQNSGAISCVLFFFQISSLALTADASPSSSGSKWAVVVAQFGSIFSLTSMSCWAPDMSAYDVTAAKLVGPCFVLLFSIAWTRFLNDLKPRLQRRGVDMDVSYSGTFAVTLLFVFSNVSSVVFLLVSCTSDGKVFIDGNVDCYNTSWRILIGIVVILCFVPIAFAGALLRNKLSEQARRAVCRAYTERLFYWGAVTLGFRLLMFITPLIVNVQYPNVSAFAHLVLSVIMFCLLMHHRPYVSVHTFWIDACCYMCLIAQFGLQTISSTRDALGTLQQPTFFDSVEVLRRMPGLASAPSSRLAL